MPKPKSKEELLLACKDNYKRLWNLIDSYSDEQRSQEFPKGMLNRNIRDVLAHLHHWHLLCLGWYKVGIEGKKPEMPAKGHNWKNLLPLNQEIQQMYLETPYNTIKEKLQKSYQETQELIKTHTDEELFEKKKYQWTGSTSLAAYLIANTSSHYNWAYKLIKKSL